MLAFPFRCWEVCLVFFKILILRPWTLKARQCQAPVLNFRIESAQVLVYAVSKLNLEIPAAMLTDNHPMLSEYLPMLTEEPVT